MEKYLKIFTDALIEATSAINEKYFHLAVAGSPIPILRERVYCYELYHQLRSRLPSENDFPYVLHGEVDKAKHPFIYDLIGRKIPDFIIHVPGHMDNKSNLVVVEVKPCGADTECIQKDVETLSLFLKRANYFKTISLVYDGNEESLIDHIQRGFSAYKDLKDHLLLFWHSKSGQPARLINWWEYL